MKDDTDHMQGQDQDIKSALWHAAIRCGAPLYRRDRKGYILPLLFFKRS